MLEAKGLVLEIQVSKIYRKCCSIHVNFQTRCVGFAVLRIYGFAVSRKVTKTAPC